MRIIKTYDGITLNCDVIAMIQPVFMNSATGVISEMVDDSFDPDNLEFAVTAFTTFGDEIVLAVYATEEERDYARYKLENWLVYDVGSYYTMTDYAEQGQGVCTENDVPCREQSDPLCSLCTARQRRNGEHRQF